MKKSVILMLVFFLLLMPVSGEATFLNSVIDQMQPIIDDTVGGLTIGGQSEQKLAQTVTVNQNGRLVGIYLPIECNSGELVIEIRNLIDDLPGDVVLKRIQIPASNFSDVVDPPVFRLIKIGGNLPLVAGEQFAVVLLNAIGDCVIFQGSEGDSYTGGDGFFDARPNPPGWIPFSDFQESRDDLPIIIRMRLP